MKAIFTSLYFARGLNIFFMASVKLHSRGMLSVWLPFTYTHLTFNSPGISLEKKPSAELLGMLL